GKVPLSGNLRGPARTSSRRSRCVPPRRPTRTESAAPAGPGGGGRGPGLAEDPPGDPAPAPRGPSRLAAAGHGVGRCSVATQFGGGPACGAAHVRLGKPALHQTDARPAAQPSDGTATVAARFTCLRAMFTCSTGTASLRTTASVLIADRYRLWAAEMLRW